MTLRTMPEPLEGGSCPPLGWGMLRKEQVWGKIRSSVSGMLSLRALSGRQPDGDFGGQ